MGDVARSLFNPRAHVFKIGIFGKKAVSRQVWDEKEQYEPSVLLYLYEMKRLQSKLKAILLAGMYSSIAFFERAKFHRRQYLRLCLLLIPGHGR